jgi:glutathionylspermidine synthase
VGGVSLIQTYHDLLTDDVAAESMAQLEDQIRRRGLFFGDRALCTVLRPRFLTVEQYTFIREHSRTVLRAFDKAFQTAIAADSFRAQFKLAPWEEELVRHDPGFRDPSPTSRLDAFFVAERNELLFTEYNTETPAAPAYNDVLSEVFYGLPAMRAFLRNYEVRPLPARPGVLHALLDAFRQWSGTREAPRIAILDWREVPTYSEFVLFADYFRSQGLACVIVDPREVEYQNGRLMAGDFLITLIYKRVLISELVTRGGLDHPVVRAVRDGAACMVNPFCCKLLHKKASLAVLQDERNAHLFDRDEHAAIEAHIPWTRLIEERRTVYKGQRIDLVPFILEHREQLVLKPNDDYGGRGVVLGWLVDQRSWEQAVQTALAEPYIVQARITLPSEPYPTLENGRLQVSDRLVDTNPYVFHGTYVDGCLTRVSTEELLNVTAVGGSMVPTFVAAKR